MEDTAQESSEEPVMAVCQITGKTVALEDSVEFRGFIVSTEGKRILLQRLLYGDPINLNIMVKPSTWRRILATLIDNLIFIVLYALLMLLLSFTVRLFMLPSVVAVFFVINVALLRSFYYFFFEGSSGATAGKWILRMRVVKKDGMPLTSWTSLKRTFFSNTLPMFVTLFGVVGWILVGGYYLTSVIAMSVEKDGSSLHDAIAGTRVVMKTEALEPALAA